MDPLLIALAGMLIIVACQFVAPKVRVASPLILLIVGLAIGFLPQVGAIEVEPHIILEIVLPPLLFSAAVRMPTMDFRREMHAVAMLAIPLVFLSAFAVGFVINWLVPAISLPWGVALGAVLSPTDAVAVSIAKRSGVSHRIITVLEGEGLFNDATSLVLLSAAMSAGLAADEHALHPGILIGKVASRSVSQPRLAGSSARSACECAPSSRNPQRTRSSPSRCPSLPRFPPSTWEAPAWSPPSSPAWLSRAVARLLSPRATGVSPSRTGRP